MRPKKKILVLSSNGGHGHNAAADTLVNILEDKYELKVVHPIERLKFCGVRLDEQFYNRMLQFGWVRAMDLIARHIAPKIFKMKKKKLEKLISRYIEEEKPGLVVSLAPFINLPASEAARKNNVPYLMVTTDNDLCNWVHGIEKIIHPHFKATIGNDLPTTRGLLQQKNIAGEKIETLGFPLRHSFSRLKNQKELHLAYGIPMDKPAVLIMMGGAGSSRSLKYTKEIGRLDLGIHLIVCFGKNEKLAKKLKKVKLHSSNSISIVGFTHQVADLMSLSHLIITKPGPGTINEAMALHLPILIDSTSAPLLWEKANIDLVLKYGIGDRITRHNDLKILVSKYLKDTNLRAATKEAYRRLPPNIFREKIAGIVDSMCIPKQPENLGI